MDNNNLSDFVDTCDGGGTFKAKDHQHEQKQQEISLTNEGESIDHLDYIVRCFKCSELGHKRSECTEQEYHDFDGMELLSHQNSYSSFSDDDSIITATSNNSPLTEKKKQDMIRLAETFLPTYLKQKKAKNHSEDDDEP